MLRVEQHQQPSGSGGGGAGDRGNGCHGCLRLDWVINLCEGKAGVYRY